MNDLNVRKIGNGVSRVKAQTCQHGLCHTQVWFEDSESGEILGEDDPKVVFAVEADRKADREFTNLANKIGLSKALGV